MSAIAGAVWLDGRPASLEHLRSMVRSLAHRGPDEQHVRLADSCGLGHCMLRTTCESLHERLPFEQDGRVITADARIDNRDELIGCLKLNEKPRDSITDSAIILAAHAKWGEDCAQRLCGDFAFAIWDRASRVLFCGRDCFGVRPFYYYYSPGRLLAFASEIKGLLCLPGIPRVPSEKRIGDYLAQLPGDKTLTFFQDICRLPPAHALILGPGGMRLTQYWALDPDQRLELGSPQEYARTYLEVFTQAVDCRLRSAFPVGSALSGGLDSSSIVCLARDSLNRPSAKRLKTFSAVFEQVPGSDERRFIDAVVDQGGTDPYYFKADRVSPLADMEKVMWHQDEPIWTPNLYVHWGLYGLAQSQGVRVFLDGFLGDNVVGHGWEHLKDLAYHWQWKSLFRELRGISRRQTGFRLTDLVWSYFWQGSVLSRIAPLFPRDIRFANTRSVTHHPIAAAIDPEFARRIDLQARLRATQLQEPSPPDSFRQRHFRDLTSGEIPLGLEIADKASAAFDLKTCYPFTDKRFVELCMKIPPEQRIEDGRSRMILRRALQGILPPRVCWRAGKADLSHCLRLGLLTFEQDRMDEVIQESSASIGDYFNTVFLRKTYEEYKRNPRGATFESLWSLWTAVNLSVWLNQQVLTPGNESALGAVQGAATNGISTRSDNGLNQRQIGRKRK